MRDQVDVKMVTHNTVMIPQNTAFMLAGLILLLLGSGCGLPPTATVPPIIVLTPDIPASLEPAATREATPQVNEYSQVLTVLVDRSEIAFSSSMLGLPVNGTFDLAQGDVRLEPVGEQVQLYLSVVIDINSASTGNFIIDDGMRSGLNADEYPTGRFDGEADILLDPSMRDAAFTVTGTMLLNNIRRTVQMSLTDAVIAPDSFSAMGTLTVVLGDYSQNAPDFIKGSQITMNAAIAAGNVSTID